MTKEQVELIKAGDAHWVSWRKRDGTRQYDLVFHEPESESDKENFRVWIPRKARAGTVTFLNQDDLLAENCEYFGPVPEPVRDCKAEPDKESLGGLTSTVIDLIDQRIIEHLCSVFNTSEDPEPVKPVYPHYILVLEHTEPIMVGPMVFQNPVGTYVFWTGDDWSPFRENAYQFPNRESTLAVIEQQPATFRMRVEEVRE